MGQVSQRKTRNYTRICRCLYPKGHMRTWMSRYIFAFVIQRVLHHAVVKSVPRTFQQTSRVWRKNCLEHWTNEKVSYIISQYILNTIWMVHTLDVCWKVRGTDFTTAWWRTRWMTKAKIYLDIPTQQLTLEEVQHNNRFSAPVSYGELQNPLNQWKSKLHYKSVYIKYNLNG
jgi:hypothetical protein